MRSVSVYPGMTLFTVTPQVATSFASVRANPVTAARTLFERIRLSTGCLTAIDVMLMMRPHSRSFIPGSTARVMLTALSNVRRHASVHADGGCASNGPAGGPPALLTRMSTRPNSSRAEVQTRSTAAGSEMSATTEITLTPFDLVIARTVSSSDDSLRAHS